MPTVHRRSGAVGREGGLECLAVDAGALMAARAVRGVVNIATPRSRKSSLIRRNLSRQKCRWKSSRRGRCENGRARSAVDQIVALRPEPEASHRQAVDVPRVAKLQHNTPRQRGSRRLGRVRDPALRSTPTASLTDLARRNIADDRRLTKPPNARYNWSYGSTISGNRTRRIDGGSHHRKPPNRTRPWAAPTRGTLYRLGPPYVQHDAVPHRTRQAAMRYRRPRRHRRSPAGVTRRPLPGAGRRLSRPRSPSTTSRLGAAPLAPIHARARAPQAV